MPDQNITLIAVQEAERLCPDDEPRRRDAQRMILANLRASEAYRQADEPAMQWDLLHAHMARTEAEHHPASESFALRRQWEREVAYRLLERHGRAVVDAHPMRRQICTGFALPGFTFGQLF